MRTHRQEAAGAPGRVDAAAGDPGSLPRGSARAAWLGLALVLFASLAVRLPRLAEVRRAPDFTAPAVDAAFHDWWARAVAGLPLPGGDGRDPALLERAYLRPPGYPWFLGGVYALTGGSQLAARVVQLALGLAAAVLAWRAALRVAGPAAGALAGLAVGLHWLPLYFEGELQATALLLALLGLATLGWVRWHARPGAARALLVGLALGAAAIVRPNALAVLASTLLLGLAVELRRSAAGARLRGGLAFAAPFCAGAALAILPVTARNLLVSGEPVLISTNGGVNLYIGNHQGATGLVAAHLPGLGRFETCFDYPELVRRVERRAGQPLSDREVSAWFSDRALEWIRAEPGRALELLGRKALLLVGPVEVPHNKELTLERAHSGVLSRLPFPFPLLAALAVLGLAALRARPRGDPARALAAFAALSSLAWLASVLPFFVAARYRVPVLPWLALLGALGVVELVGAARARRWPQVAGRTALALAVGTALASIPVRLEPNAAKWHHDRARALLLSGRPDEALVELKAALDLDPRRHEAELTRGNVLAELGRDAEAEQAYRRVLERRPREHAALNNLGSVLARSGRLEEARDCFARALEHDPLPGPVHLNLGRVLEALGRPAEAGDHYRRALEALPAGSGGGEARRALRRLEKAGAGGDDAEPPR